MFKNFNIFVLFCLLFGQLGCNSEYRQAGEELQNFERLGTIYQALEKYWKVNNRMPESLQDLVDAQLLKSEEIKYTSRNALGLSFIYFKADRLDQTSDKILVASPETESDFDKKNKQYRSFCRHNGFVVTLPEDEFQSILINGPPNTDNRTIIDASGSRGGVEQMH